MDLNPPPIAFYGSLWEALPDTSAIKLLTCPGIFGPVET